MMLLNGFPSRSALQRTIEQRRAANKEPLRFMSYAMETSIHGPEFTGAGEYTVCMDHPKRTRFARVAVDSKGYIISAK